MCMYCVYVLCVEVDREVERLVGRDAAFLYPHAQCSIQSKNQPTVLYCNSDHKLRQTLNQTRWCDSDGHHNRLNPILGILKIYQ